MYLILLVVGIVPVNGLAVEPSRASSVGESRNDKQAQEEKILRDISDRLHRMLERQRAIYEKTKALDKVIQGRVDKVARPADQEAMRKLTDDVQDIIDEASKAIDILKANESVAAFAEVFQQLRDELRRVKGHLAKVEVGNGTQTLEKETIETLEDMIEGLGSR
jgi:hypothetical protein